MRILVIASNGKLKTQLKQHLLSLNYEVLSSSSTNEAFLTFKDRKPDLIIIDLNLSSYNGLVLCKKFRNESTIPIVILSTFSNIEDRLAGFASGATDYIMKPFSIKELAARVNALLNLVGSTKTNAKKKQATFSIGNIVFDSVKQQVYRDKSTVKLTRIESELLELLSLNAGYSLSRPVILKNIWGYIPERSVDLRVVDVYIVRLRSKIEEVPAAPELILTVRGVGYKLPKH
jgi:OmpR family response regulator RpaB